MKGVLVLAVFLLYSATVNAAEKTITIKPGEYNFGPIPIGKLDRYGEMLADRSTAFTSVTTLVLVELSYSTDTGKTFTLFCRFGFTGGNSPGNVSGAGCEIPAGVTHISGWAQITGGNLVLTSNPTLRAKQ